MQTITIDILNKKALKLLEDLEHLQLIRLHKEIKRSSTPANRIRQYKGAMAKQSIDDVDKQLNELRDEWE